MALEWLGRFDLNPRIFGSFYGKQFWQVASKMKSEREEVRNDDHSPQTALYGGGDSSTQVRLGAFEKGCAYIAIRPHTLNLPSQLVHTLVSFFHTAAVGE